MVRSPSSAAGDTTSKPALGDAAATQTSLRILLVEDDAIISAMLAELLHEFGHTVCASARNEMEAIAAATRHVPDLMIVDVQLQAGSGVSVMETVLRHRAMPHIFMTAGSRQDIPANAVVLQKPFGLRSLQEAIARMARKTQDATRGDRIVAA